MIPKRYDFKPHIAGDTFNGVQITMTLTSEGVTAPIDLTGMAIKIVFKKQDQTTVISTLEIGSGITIDDAVNGVFSIDPFVVFTTPYLYEYDMQFTYSGGNVKTYMKGFFLSKPQITT